MKYVLRCLRLQGVAFCFAVWTDKGTRSHEDVSLRQLEKSKDVVAPLTVWSRKGYAFDQTPLYGIRHSALQSVFLTSSAPPYMMLSGCRNPPEELDGGYTGGEHHENASHAAPAARQKPNPAQTLTSKMTSLTSCSR